MTSENNFISWGLWWVLAAALLLRLVGIGFGLPHLYHQDEPIIVNHALAYSAGDLNPHFFKIPPLLSYLLFVIYGAAFLAGHALLDWSRDHFALLFFEDPTFFYLSGRVIFGAILGSASVWVLYRIGKKLFSQKTAFLAAVFLATSYLHVRDSHYLYVDIPMIFCLLMAIHALLNQEGRLEQKHFFLAGVWVGVATAFKYTAAPFFVSLVIAAIFSGRSDVLQARGRLILFLKSLAGAVVTFALLNLFAFLDFKFVISDIFQQASAEGPTPFFHHLVYSLIGSEGVVRVLLGLGGFVVIFLKKPHVRWLLSFPLAYYLMIAFFSQPYERYAMPLVPLGLVFGAYFLLEFVAPYLEKWPWKKTVLGILITAAILPPLVKTIWLEGLLLRTDTRTLALNWIEQNIPASSVVVLDHPFFSPRLRQVPDQIQKKKEWLTESDPHRISRQKKLQLLLKVAELSKKSYRIFYFDPAGSAKAPFMSWSPVVSPDTGALRAAGVQYFIRYRYPGETPFFKNHLQNHAKLIALFSPYRTPSKVFTDDTLAQVALPFKARELFSRLRLGPFLEVYKVEMKN